MKRKENKTSAKEATKRTAADTNTRGEIFGGPSHETANIDEMILSLSFIRAKEKRQNTTLSQKKGMRVLMPSQESKEKVKKGKTNEF